MIIYKATSKTSGKSYIGKTTKSLPDRINAHLKNVKRGKITKFYNAIRKYGIEDFVWEIVTNATSEKMLNILETENILREDSFINGYNMTLGGDGGDTISMKSEIDKKRQGAKKGNIPWNKGINMKEMGYTFKDRKSRPKFTVEQKKLHSNVIKSSSKYKDGLKNRTPAKQIIIKDSLGNQWRTQKEWMKEFGLKYREAKRILSGVPFNGIIYQPIRVR